MDSFVDNITLNILSKKHQNAEVLIVSNNKKCKITTIDIDKFNSEYSMFKIQYTTIFQDIFIIIDGCELYHLGASLKDLGKKVFGINKLEDKYYLDNLIKRIDNITI